MHVTFSFLHNNAFIRGSGKDKGIGTNWSFTGGFPQKYNCKVETKNNLWFNKKKMCATFFFFNKFLYGGRVSV
jgi:hypothetical protein